MSRVLLIEDDEQIAASLAKVLRQLGEDVEVAGLAAHGLAALRGNPPDVVVLDPGLPDIEGLDVVKMIRSIDSVPIIVATARDDEPTIVRALDLGADDYVVKPFSGNHLAARIRAMLRRGRPARAGATNVGDLRVDVAAHEATLDGQPLDLRRKEFELLALLASRAGTVVSRDDIAREVWDDPQAAHTSTIDVHISSLRRRLGESAAEPRYIEAVRGVGVKLVDPAQGA
ncbi:MAG: response regulator transcription factor [Miltoncostaeaceae bacterium]